MTFDEFMAEHGWRHVVQDYPAGEHNGETWEAFRSHDACKETMHEGLIYAYCISLPSGLYHGCLSDWERHLPVLEKFWELFLEREGIHEPASAHATDG